MKFYQQELNSVFAKQEIEMHFIFRMDFAKIFKPTKLRKCTLLELVSSTFKENNTSYFPVIVVMEKFLINKDLFQDTNMKTSVHGY